MARFTALWTLLAFSFAAGARETLHSACPMHDGAALAAAVHAASAEATAGHTHQAHSTSAEDDPGSPQGGSHACDCMGDCAPGSVRGPALLDGAAPAPVALPVPVVVVLPLEEPEAQLASVDHFLPPATAPPSFL
jgi:hypothetical protein